MSVRILRGDVRDRLRDLPDESVHCVVTSPPYWGLRDYGHAGQIGLEATPDAFVAALVGVFQEVRRVLRDDGTAWINLGDTYSANRGYQVPDGKWIDVGNSRGMSADVIGLRPKNLVGIPWRVAFALQADGWYLRQDIIWSKPNPMPESVRDRCTKAHEYIFLLAKSERYYYDAAAVQEACSEDSHGSPNVNPGWKQDAVGNDQGGTLGKWTAEDKAAGRNKRSVWTVTTQPFKEAHFATFPPALIEPCILAGCPVGGTVLDPFGGAGTTGLVADRLQRDAILIELNPDYADMAERRIRGDSPLFAQVGT